MDFDLEKGMKGKNMKKKLLNALFALSILVVVAFRPFEGGGYPRRQTTPYPTVTSLRAGVIYPTATRNVTYPTATRWASYPTATP